MLGALEKKRGAKVAFARGYQPVFSELYLRNGSERTVHFRAGSECPDAALKAFKRSLSAGILDGGSSEISMGGSRLNRFMKDVENVTGKMGEGEAVTPTEEAPATVPPEASVADAEVAAPYEAQADAQAEAPKVGAGGTVPEADSTSAPPLTSDPWSALLSLGSQFVAAMTDAPSSHPWIERDPASGARRLNVPLPPPETAARIADTLNALAHALRTPR